MNREVKRPHNHALIPWEVRYDEELSSTEKLFYGEITALAETQGYCYATNRYFAVLYAISPSQVSRIISKLKAKGLISTEAGEGNYRIIHVSNPEKVRIARSRHTQKAQDTTTHKPQYNKKAPKGAEGRMYDDDADLNLDFGAKQLNDSETSEYPASTSYGKKPQGGKGGFPKKGDKQAGMEKEYGDPAINRLYQKFEREVYPIIGNKREARRALHFMLQETSESDISTAIGVAANIAKLKADYDSDAEYAPKVRDMQELHRKFNQLIAWGEENGYITVPSSPYHSDN